MGSPLLEDKMKKLEACPLCGNGGRRRLYPLEHSTVFRCAGCGLSYLDPCLDPAAMAAVYESSETLKLLNEFHDGYYEYGDPEVDSVTVLEFKRSLALLSARLSGDRRRLFEVGFGSGLFLAVAKRQGWQVDGIDTSRTNAELARKKFSLELRTGFFEEMPLPDPRPDALAMLDVIEHIADPHRMIQRAHQVLAKDGLLLIATPNEDSFFRALSDFLFRASGGRITTGIRKIYFLEHVTYYTRATLEQLLRQNGFEPAGHFYSGTDLAKYRLKPLERLAGESILLAQRVLSRQNRLLMIARRA